MNHVLKSQCKFRELDVTKKKQLTRVECRGELVGKVFGADK